MTQHSLEEKTLTELKHLALEEFELSPEQVGEFGDRRCRSVWIKAIKAAQSAGKTTQEHRELPVIKTLAELAIEQQSEQELWRDDMAFLGAVEHFFFQQRRAGWVVSSDLLDSMHLDDERFSYWADWMVPGNLFTTYRQNRTYQILMVDKTSKIYYLPIDKPQLMATYLMAVRKFAYPTPLPESGEVVEAAEYIKLMHEATEHPDYRQVEV